MHIKHGLFGELKSKLIALRQVKVDPVLKIDASFYSIKDLCAAFRSHQTNLYLHLSNQTNLS